MSVAATVLTPIVMVMQGLVVVPEVSGTETRSTMRLDRLTLPRLPFLELNSCNKLGAKMYPKGTNHFSPYSALFKDHQRKHFSLVMDGCSVH